MTCIETDCSNPRGKARNLCHRCYMRRWRAGTLEPIAHRQNPFAQECIDLFHELKAEQDARLEAECVGYDTEIEDFHREIEPRITYAEVLKQVSREWGARRNSANSNCTA